MDNFLEKNSWFDLMFREKSDGRYITFRLALNLLHHLKFPYIVETGTIRQVNDYGAGYSTFIFGEYIHRYGGKITTIDISKENIDICKMVTDQYKDHIEYIIDDSLHALSKIENAIDLLYLDSLDMPLMGDATDCQEHNLNEFKIVEPLLHNKSIVLLDDNDFESGGKTKLTKIYLKKKGWRNLFNGQQSIWII